MATAGILKAENVVFYHPLDDFVESAVGQTWTGSGGFTAGKIGSANSAVTGDAVAWGPVATVVADARTSTSTGTIVRLDSTRAVIPYFVTGGSIKAKVATISGSTVTFGPEHTATASANQTNNGQFNQPSAVFLSTDKFLLLYTANGSFDGALIVGTVSGTDITFGAETVYSSPGRLASGVSLAVLTSTSVLVLSVFAFPISLRVATISGTTVTAGPSFEVSATGPNQATNSVCALDSTRAIVTWLDGPIETAVVDVSGTDITITGQVELASAPTSVSGLPSCLALSSTKVAYVWQAGSPDGQRGRIADVAGSTITFGTNTQISSITSFTSAAVALTSTKFVAIVGSGGDRIARMVTVSGLSFTVGASSSTTTAQGAGTVARLDDASFLHVSTTLPVTSTTGTMDAAVGALGQEASMAAPTPAAYPSTIGETRVVAAMWAKSLTGGSSTVTVERGYSIAMTATSIALGGTTATWSGAGIGTLMTTMNDGSSHLLVLDFDNEGGTTWRLRTSVDGAAFTDQGTQTSGTQAVTAADTAPGLDIASGASGQWIDELVMWAGDNSTFEPFTTQEMANLFDLADTFGEPMDQFQENFGAPICWQATATMPDGTVWRDSGSGSCPPVVRVPRGASDIVVTDDGAPASPRVIEG